MFKIFSILLCLLCALPLTALEVRPGYKLIGPNANKIDLASAAPKVERIPIDPSTKISVDERTMRHTEKFIVFRTGPSLRLILDADGYVIGANGRGLSVIKIGQVPYFETASANTEKASFSEEDVVPPRKDKDKTELTARLDLMDVSARQARCTRTDPKRIFEIAIATNFEFCKDVTRGTYSYPVARAEIYRIISEAQVSFTASSCLQLKLVCIELHCKTFKKDPYDAIDRLTRTSVLPNLRNMWLRETRYKVIRRDVVVFLSGPRSILSFASSSYRGGVCGSYGYSWVSHDVRPVEALIHSLGSTIGLKTASSGVMKSLVSPGNRAFSATSAASLRYILQQSSTACITGSSSPPSKTPTPTSSPKCQVQFRSYSAWLGWPSKYMVCMCGTSYSGNVAGVDPTLNTCFERCIRTSTGQTCTLTHIYSIAHSKLSQCCSSCRGKYGFLNRNGSRRYACYTPSPTPNPPTCRVVISSDSSWYGWPTKKMACSCADDSSSHLTSIAPSLNGCVYRCMLSASGQSCSSLSIKSKAAEKLSQCCRSCGGTYDILARNGLKRHACYLGMVPSCSRR